MEQQSKVKSAFYYMSFPKEIRDVFLENEYVADNWRDVTNFIKGVFEYDKDDNIVVLKDIRYKGTNAEFFTVISKDNYNHTVNNKVWQVLDIKAKLRIIKWIYLDFCEELNVKPFEIVFALPKEDANKYENCYGLYYVDKNFIFININKNLCYTEYKDTIRHELQHVLNRINLEEEYDALKNSLQKPNQTSIDAAFYHVSKIKELFEDEQFMLQHLDEKNKKLYQKMLKNDDMLYVYDYFLELFYCLNGDEKTAFNNGFKQLQNYNRYFRSVRCRINNKIKKLTDKKLTYEENINFDDPKDEKLFQKLSSILSIMIESDEVYQLYKTEMQMLKQEKDPKWKFTKDPEYLELYKKHENIKIKFNKCINYLFRMFLKFAHQEGVFVHNNTPQIENGFFKEIETNKSFFETMEDLRL